MGTQRKLITYLAWRFDHLRLRMTPLSNMPKEGGPPKPRGLRFRINEQGTSPYNSLSHVSTSTFPILSRDPSFQKTSGNPWKRRVFEKNDGWKEWGINP